ncbi:LysM peptidoglycan-binding domain-containing protein [uncultured Lactobacillus sp.]|uniref:aggregation-promoting factor n=1 Tax=uncultured Lactobacillus sp. TaxID=153152 RepID=UPI0023D2B017|nr:LysM peptidoglycan-binding domain-containing protein [uncultured Lactobacillus sp.]MDE7056126.1 LysM peptidoglycan-binding domain-containing protein [Lactobacillus sp.]
MKLTTKQLLLFFGGSVAAVTAKSSTTMHAHADTVTVKKGDTTWNLAKEYNEHHTDSEKTSVEQIVKDNQLSAGGSLIFENQKLNINKDDGQPKNVDANPPKSTTTQSVQPSQGISYSQTSNSSTQVTTHNSSTNNNNQENTASSVSVPASSNYTSTVNGNERAAKEWIASRESGGSYTARNGRYYGRYQLDTSYLGGDYSASHQEQVADNYVHNRYGSWTNAQSFWQNHGWY